MKGQWYKAKFSTRNGLCYNTETALVLAEDEVQALNFIRKMADVHFVEAEVVPYCAVPVMTVDFMTLHKGESSNIDYIVVAL